MWANRRCEIVSVSFVIYWKCNLEFWRLWYLIQRNNNIKRVYGDAHLTALTQHRQQNTPRDSHVYVVHATSQPPGVPDYWPNFDLWESHDTELHPVMNPCPVLLSGKKRSSSRRPATTPRISMVTAGWRWNYSIYFERVQLVSCCTSGRVCEPPFLFH